jgi:hypothetical protein
VQLRCPTILSRRECQQLSDLSSLAQAAVRRTAFGGFPEEVLRKRPSRIRHRSIVGTTMFGEITGSTDIGTQCSLFSIPQCARLNSVICQPVRGIPARVPRRSRRGPDDSLRG